MAHDYVSHNPFSLLIERKVTVDASTQADWRLLRLSFKAWHDDAKASGLERSIDHRRLQELFRCWIVRQRGVLLCRVREQRLLQEALEIWRERFEGIRSVLDNTFDIAEKGRNLRLLGASIAKWRTSLTMRTEDFELAAVSPDLIVPHLSDFS